MRSAPRALTLLLVRHGQSEWNAAGLWQGQTPDVPLTEVGHGQARAAARALAPLAPGALLSSDLVRATQTADHCARSTGLPYATTAALREQAYGVLEGRSARDAARLVDGADLHWAAEGAESRAQLHHRVNGYLQALWAQPPADVVALVTHGDTIRAAQAVVCGRGPEGMPAVTPHNGSITVLRLTGLAWPRPAGASRASTPPSARPG